MEHITKNARGGLNLYGDWIVAGDFHIPQESLHMMALIMQEGRERKIRNLLINGDLFNEDAFSDFDRKQDNAKWKIEEEAAEFFFDYMLKWFKHIVILLGNHDKRLLKKTKYALSFESIIKMVTDREQRDKITLTDWSHVTVNDKWLVCHPEEYSRKPGFKAEQLGKKYVKNVIAGHSHILSETEYEVGKDLSPTDKQVYIDGGCCLNFDVVEYETFNVSTCTGWSQGFVVIFGNSPYIGEDHEIIAARPSYDCVFKLKECRQTGEYTSFRKEIWDDAKTSKRTPRQGY